MTGPAVFLYFLCLQRKIKGQRIAHALVGKPSVAPSVHCNAEMWHLVIERGQGTEI